MDRTEQWFKAFKAEADAFDIYGAGCAASNNANLEHCQAIEAHSCKRQRKRNLVESRIEAIKELEEF